MGIHTDQLGTIDNFKAPWESDTGTDSEIDPAKLKKYLYNLTLDKAKAQDARDEGAEAVTKAQKDLKDAKAEVAKGDPSGKIAELEAKLVEATDTATKAQGNLDRLEVGIEKGLTPKQAARLQGATREELEKDAEEILETFGVQKTAETDEEREEREEREAEEAEEAAEGRQSPRLVNASDPKLNKIEAEVDYDKAVSEIFARRVI